MRLTLTLTLTLTVYQAALNALAATAEVSPAEMLPRIAALVLPAPPQADAPEAVEAAAAAGDAAAAPN